LRNKGDGVSTTTTEYVELLWKQDAVLIKETPFTLKSGRESCVYVNHRDLVCLPSAARLIKAAVVELVETFLPVDEVAVATVDSSVSPLLGAMCVDAGIPLYVTRPVNREKGLTNSLFSYDALSAPDCSPDRPAVIVDDVLTTTSTVGAAAELLRRHGRTVLGVVCLVDRRVTEDVGKTSLDVRSVATLEDVLSFWLTKASIAGERSTQALLVRDELSEVRRP
jgi:orotate phosphoribosyltransferase